MPDVEQLLTVPEAAGVLGVHPMTVRRLVWDGDLSWVNVGRGKSKPRIRIRQSVLERYMASRERAGKAA